VGGEINMKFSIMRKRIVIENHTGIRKVMRNRIFIGLFIASAVFLTGCSHYSKPEPEKSFQTEYAAPGLPSSGQFRTVAVADFNNDGHPDLAAGGSFPGTVGIWLGDGVGGVSPPAFLPFEADVRSIVIGDFDEDGYADVAVSVQRESAGIMVWKNMGAEGWKRIPGPTDIYRYQGIAAADVNRDGHLDLVAANGTAENQGGIQVWIGDGRGGWYRESGPTVTGLYMDVLLADFNDDGNLDLAGAGWGRNGALKIWLGNGAGGWTSTPPVARGSFYGLNAADMNGDGHLDLLAGTYRSGVSLFSGDGRGNFDPLFGPLSDRSEEVLVSNEGTLVQDGSDVMPSQSKTIIKQNRSFWDVFPMDLDGDGDLDIVASSMSGQGLRAWENKADNNWHLIQDRFPDEGSFYDIVADDLNADGYDEIVVAGFGNGIKVWHGKEVSGQSEFTWQGTGGGRKENKQLRGQFVRENESFTTINGVPEYRIGPQDILEITIWKGLEATKSMVEVSARGTISIGFIDDFHAVGLTPSQLDERITERLTEFIKNPKVDMTVKSYKSKYVSLMGAIGTGTGGSNRVPMDGRTTVLDALGEQGGMAKNANMSDVRIRKKTGQTITVDLFKALFQGDLNQDVVLDNGDVVYVPWLTEEANRVYVLGEVRSPGIYSFKGSSMKIFDAVMMAGGATLFAKEGHTKIVRGDVTQPEVLSADIKQLTEEGDQTQNVDLLNGDLVYVPRSFIGDIKLFVDRISPILTLIKTPGDYMREARSYETTGRILRTD
jgi:polysaccharide biosynthesis/export protein